MTLHLKAIALYDQHLPKIRKQGVLNLIYEEFG